MSIATDEPIAGSDDETRPATAPAGGMRPESGGAVESGRILRPAIAVSLPTIAAAVMVGGIFTGLSPRIFAAVGGLLGIALAVASLRIRRPLLGYAVIAGGLF